MERNPKTKDNNQVLRIDQANVYYNYTLGLDSIGIDLVKTAGNLLKKGITRAVFFSDFKCLYTNVRAEIKLEWIHQKGRQWDSNWEIQFGSEVPTAATKELFYASELSFHAQRIEGYNAKQISPYLYAFLPPVVLEDDNLSLPIFVSLKLFADGIAILSFQLDTTWDGVDENYFVSNIVNLYQCYFKSIWIDARIQRLDAEELLPLAFLDDMSIAGNPVSGFKTRQLLRKMRKESRQLLNESLDEKGRCFSIDNEEWILHEIEGSNDQDLWESSMDLCRSEYTNALCKIVIPSRENRKLNKQSPAVWQGRPSVSLMRFHEQPSTKSDLLSRFAPSLLRILMRSTGVDKSMNLPPDLRPFGDYCFHGNRALLLWTWLRPNGSPENVWNDPITRTALLENQARSEHIEYYNMLTARACTWAQSPPSNDHLKAAYKILSVTDEVIHHSSQAGEITEALSYLMSEFGTLKLVSSGKEAARWHLDELRYRSDRSRNLVGQWLAFVFGLIGAAGLADFAILPYLAKIWPNLDPGIAPIVAFGLAGFIVLLLAFFIWFINRLCSLP